MLHAAALEDREDIGIALVVNEDADCVMSVGQMSSSKRELLGDVVDGVCIGERVCEGGRIVLSEFTLGACCM